MLEEEHALLAARLAIVPEDTWNDGLHDDAVQLWQRLGMADAQRVPGMDVATLQQQAAACGIVRPGL